MYEDGRDKVILMDLLTGRASVTQLAKSSSFLVSTGGKQGKPKEEQKSVESTHILDMEYVDGKKYGLLLTSSSDGYIRGWRLSQKTFVLAHQPDNE